MSLAPPLPSQTGGAGLASMTGFARSDGMAAGVGWAWELRSVNGRGLEVRLRLPPGFDALEPPLREEAGKQLRRGNVNGTLTLRREERTRVSADPVLLDELLRLATELAERIPGAAPPRPEALLALPGVLRATTPDDGLAPDVLEQVRAGFTSALTGLVSARREEGARLHAVLGSQLGAIVVLHGQAAVQATQQPERQRARMMESLQALLRDQPGLPQERIAQEVALLATRSDVREELDRLHAHVQAASALLAEGVGVGRRFDFLVQEFLRETNTLCSKSATTELTSTGLQLKALIEQMREQVQNVE